MTPALDALVYSNDDDINGWVAQGDHEARCEIFEDRAELEAKIASTLDEANTLATEGTSREAEISAAYAYGFVRGYEQMLDQM